MDCHSSSEMLPLPSAKADPGWERESSSSGEKNKSVPASDGAVTLGMRFWPGYVHFPAALWFKSCRDGLRLPYPWWCYDIQRRRRSDNCLLAILLALHVPLHRHRMKFSERISPWPESSILKTSILDDLSSFRILHTPSPAIVTFNPAKHHVVSFPSTLTECLRSERDG